MSMAPARSCQSGEWEVPIHKESLHVKYSRGAKRGGEQRWVVARTHLEQHVVDECVNWVTLEHTRHP